MGEAVAEFLDKGGSTRTTSTVHLSHAAALEGGRVLVIDTDGQQHSSKWLRPDDAPELTLHNVVLRPESIREAICKTRIPGVDLVYASKALPLVAEAVLKASADGEPRQPYGVLADAVSYVKDDYHLVLIDCAPGITPLNTNALVACDHVLVPLDVSDMSFDGLKGVIGTLMQMTSGKKPLLDSMPPVSVLLTKIETDESKGVADLRARIVELGTRDNGAFRLLQSQIRYRKQVRTELYSSGVDAFDLAATGTFKHRHLQAVADDYRNAMRELMTILNAQTKARNEGVAV